MPLPNSSVEQWRMVVIVTGHTLFVTSQCDVIFTFARLLTCIVRDGRAAVGQGSSKRVEGNGNLKNKKS